MAFKNPYIFHKGDIDVWKSYYLSRTKRGNGLPGFIGDDFQQGDGLMDIARSAWPFIKTVGKKLGLSLLKTGADALEGENVLDSLKTRGKAAARDIATDIADRATQFAQTGKGKRRRRRRKATKAAKKVGSKRKTGKRRFTKKNFNKKLFF